MFSCKCDLREHASVQYNAHMDLKLPIIITNFKAYETAIGKAGLELARIHAKVAEATGASLAIAVSHADIRMISQEVNIPVLSQHVDADKYGAATGRVVPEIVYDAGAVGTLLNHSEHRIPQDAWERSINRAQDAGLFVVACAQDPDEAESLFRFGPELVAYEPPELIGGDFSVSTAKPECIRQAFDKVGEGKLLAGAGVKNAQDVRIALQLGAVGVLLASGVTKAADPEKVLRDLISGLN